MCKENVKAVAAALQKCFVPEKTFNGVCYGGETFAERCEGWALHGIEQLESEIEEHRLMLKWFEDVAKAYHECLLPEDDGSWSMLSVDHANVTVDDSYSITDVLCYLEEADEVMPEGIIALLGLPQGSTYAEGVDRIYKDTSRRAPMPRLSPEERARREAQGVADDSTLALEDRAFLKELAEME